MRFEIGLLGYSMFGLLLYLFLVQVLNYWS